MATLLVLSRIDDSCWPKQKTAQSMYERGSEIKIGKEKKGKKKKKRRVSMGEGPLGPLKLHLVAKIQFGNSRQVRTCRTEAFFSKLLCLA